MIRSFIQALSFFLKEFHDVRRQPRLLLSLVGGPLLVLGAFGATFKSANPFIATALVWPKDGIQGVDQKAAEDFIGSNFYLYKVTTDRAVAMDLLNSGFVEVVQIIPDVSKMAQDPTIRPEIEVIARTVDPNAEAWIRSLTYGEMNYINQSLLTQEASMAQTRAREVDASLQTAQVGFEGIKSSLSPQNIDTATNTASSLRTLLTGFLSYLPDESKAQANLAPELVNMREHASSLIDDLTQLERVLKESDLPAKMDRLSVTIEQINGLRGTVNVFVGIPPQDIISPIRLSYTNQLGKPFSLVVFYTPAVLALLVQQLAITLASLGLVRERQMGSFEMFRVSPLKFAQILYGKAAAYILYVTLAGIILTGLLALMQVPMPKMIGNYIVMMVVLATASTGIGFLISAVSQTDSQAIQLTMLMLLLSIFFTGFFMPIEGFAWPAWIISLLLPMSHGITGFQQLLLHGESADGGVWIGLALVIFISYGLVGLIMRRQYRKTTS